MIRFRVSPSVVVPVTGIRVCEDFSAVSIVGADENGADQTIANVVNPLSYPRHDFEIANYKIALFTHRNWPEARVQTLRFANQRVGLLFSLQALASEQSVLPNEEFWNEYGFIALQKICLGEYDYGPDVLPVPKGDQSKITEIFSDDTIILVLDKGSCLPVMTEEGYQTLVEECLPSLARHGFYRLERDSGPGDFRANGLAVEAHQTSLTLLPFSQDFPRDAVLFFRDIILRSVQREHNPAFRLFLGYQLIEILLADLFGHVIRNFASEAAKARTTELRDLNEALKEDIRESGRISRVFNANRGPETNQAFENLQASCEAMLASLCASESKTYRGSRNAETALYSVRNHVFHSYSRVSHLRGEIEQIAHWLFILLCELSIAYKAPIGTDT